MKLTRKTEYAFLALIYLAENYEKNLIKTKDIVEEKQIPQKYLEQILLQLKSSGYLKSLRGKNGGYMLAKEPSKINLAEISRLFDGPLAPSTSVSTYFYDESPLKKETKMIAVLKDIRDYTAEILENTTLADLIK
jgi:Rrf2 family protein